MKHMLSVAVLLLLALGAQAGLRRPGTAIPQDMPQATTPAPTAQTEAQPARKIPCKTPENASMCYWTRGRLNFYQGNLPYRIWKVGTKRIVSINSGPSRFLPRTEEDATLPEFPANLERAYKAEYERNVAAGRVTPYLIGPVFADFEICPLEPDTPGEMQASCIESAKNIFVELSKRGYR